MDAQGAPADFADPSDAAQDVRQDTDLAAIVVTARSPQEQAFPCLKQRPQCGALHGVLTSCHVDGSEGHVMMPVAKKPTRTPWTGWPSKVRPGFAGGDYWPASVSDAKSNANRSLPPDGGRITAANSITGPVVPAGTSTPPVEEVLVR